MSFYGLAKEVYEKTPRYHLLAQCHVCKYAEEAVFAFSVDANLAATRIGKANLMEYCNKSLSEYQNALKFVDDLYKAKGYWATHQTSKNRPIGKPHPHLVDFTLELTKDDIEERHSVSYPAF